MKKLLSSVLACVAILGLSSCVQEDIETTFEVGSAKAIINVGVLDLGSESDVTAQSTITSPYGNGNVITITGNKNIPATNVTITAKYVAPSGKAYTSTYTLPINALRAGGTATYMVVIPVGEITPLGDYTFKFSDPYQEETYKDTSWLDKVQHNIVHYDGQRWVENASEFILRGTVDWKSKNGLEIIADHCACDTFEEKFDTVLDVISKISPVTETDEVKDIEVSAWAAYTAYQVVFTEEKTFDFIAVDIEGYETLVGTFTTWSYSTECSYEEWASPNHASHYNYGHGVDDPAISHGGAHNAGGGIVIAD